VKCVSQENAFTRARRLPGLPDRLSALCEAQSRVWTKGGQRQSCSSEKSRSVVSCLRLHLWSENPLFLDRCGGWMWSVERFAAPGRPIGVGTMSRCLNLRTFPRAFPLPLAHHVPSVRVTAGVGVIGSHAIPGSDHLNCVSPSQAFPLSSPATNTSRPSWPSVTIRSTCVAPRLRRSCSKLSQPPLLSSAHGRPAITSLLPARSPPNAVRITMGATPIRVWVTSPTDVACSLRPRTSP
jgi:hypothetical protein